MSTQTSRLGTSPLALLAPVLAALFVAGCGSSSEPTTQPHVNAGPAIEAEAGVAPRALKTASLLPYSPQNLLLDVTFREGGWGHFMSYYEASQNQLTTPSRILSDSPGGVGAPVAIFKDTTATDVKSRSITSLSSFLGGKGPFVARVWVSRSNIAGEPIDLPKEATVFRASIASDVASAAKAWDFQPKTTRMHGARTWVLYEARIIDNLPSAFFMLRFGRLGGQFMVTAPEVVPLSLMPAGASTMSNDFPVPTRDATTEELAAAAAYARQPIQLGLPKVPQVVPGMHATHAP